MLQATDALSIITLNTSAYTCSICFLILFHRFVEMEKDVTLPMAIFLKKGLLGKCTKMSFIVSTPLWICRSQHILIHKVLNGIAARGKCFMK